jgi:diaminopimelate epimerase
MRLPIVHCHGSGNDFPLVDARALALDEPVWAELARLLSDRDGPVGGDGLLALTAGDLDHAFGMRMWNADGSEAETCLNGLRCVARAGLSATGADRARVRLATSSAEVWAAPELAPGVATYGERAGPVETDAAAFPIGDLTGEWIDRPLPWLGAQPFTAVRMPNPHLVGFVDRVNEDALIAAGLACEAAPAWLPNRANVSFVEVRGAAELYVRTFERGVGLTDSCGSAMAAATWAACRTGRMAWDADATVRNRGGLVRATAGRDGSVTLLGNATWEWAGEIEVADGAVRLAVAERFDEEVAAWTRARGLPGRTS